MSPMHTALVTAVNVSTGGASSWLKENAVTVVLITVAVGAMWAARKGEVAKVISIVAAVLVAVCLLGLATGNTAVGVGEFLVGLLTGGGK